MKKRRLPPSDDLSEGEDIDLEESETEDDTKLNDLTFKPLHLISVWKEPHTMTKRITVAILLPSGVEAGEFAVRVMEGGKSLELSVVWPLPLMEPKTMHKKWLDLDNQSGFASYHPKVVGFQQALKQLRSRSSQEVESVAIIALPFAVQTHIESKYNLCWKGTTVRMVYIDLKAVMEQYAHINDNESFEVVE